jgi:hypothetical protein
MPIDDLREGRPNELYFNDMLAYAMEEVTPGTWSFRTSTSTSTTSFPNSGNLQDDLYFNDMLARVMEEVSPGVWALRTDGGGGGGVGTLQQVLTTGNIAQEDILLKHPTDIARTRVNITTDATRGVVAAHGGNNGSALPDGAYASIRDASLEINLDGTTKGILSTAPLTAERNYTLPDNDGTVALLTDIAQDLDSVLGVGNSSNNNIILTAGGGQCEYSFDGFQLDNNVNTLDVNIGTLTGNRAITYPDDDGVIALTKDTGWQNITTVGTGWTVTNSTGTGGTNAQYRIINGLCYLSGIATAGLGAVAAMVTLPVGARPLQRVYLNTQDGTTVPIFFNAAIQTTGNVQVLAGVASVSLFSLSNFPPFPVT